MIGTFDHWLGDRGYLLSSTLGLPLVDVSIILDFVWLLAAIFRLDFQFRS
jgi:hypothetical protein